MESYYIIFFIILILFFIHRQEKQQIIKKIILDKKGKGTEMLTLAEKFIGNGVCFIHSTIRFREPLNRSVRTVFS